MERIEKFMDSDGFTSIYINDMTFSNDMLLVVLLLMLSVFAIIYRRNTSLLRKMAGDIFNREPKGCLFDTTSLPDVFMGFQTIALLSIYAFSLATKYGYVESSDIKTTLLWIVGLILAFFIYFSIKTLIFSALLFVFAENEKQKLLKISYKSLFLLWGVFLYIPVLWILLIGDYIVHATILLIISYIFITIILAYRFIFAFFGRNSWLLFLNLYLCAHEIVPLAFLYKGLIYIYRIIDENIWQ
jgi:hypothetical protein